MVAIKYMLALVAVSLTFGLVISDAPDPKKACSDAIVACSKEACDKIKACLELDVTKTTCKENEVYRTNALKYHEEVCKLEGVKEVPQCVQLLTQCTLEFNKPEECDDIKTACLKEDPALKECKPEMITKFFDSLKTKGCDWCVKLSDCVDTSKVDIKCTDKKAPDADQVACTNCRPTTKDNDLQVLNVLCAKDATAAYNKEKATCSWQQLSAGVLPALALNGTESACTKRETTDKAWTTCPSTKSDFLNKYFATAATCGATAILAPTAIIFLLVAALTKIF